MIRKSKDKLRKELKPSCHGNEGDPVGLEPSEEMIKKTKKQVKRELHESRRKRRIQKEGINKDHTPSTVAMAKSEDHTPSTVVMENSEDHTPSIVTADTAAPKGHGK